jgi:ribosomal protein S18 acetylase RimI-like enzyme
VSEAVEVRRLTADEAGTFRALRIEGLTLDAATFGSDAGEEAARPDAWFEARIGEGVFGAFIGGALVGIAGYTRQTSAKQRHKAQLYGMYLRADQRGLGIAGKLVAAVIEHARAAGAEMLLLACHAGNRAAIRLYELAGFQRYGVEPRALRQPDGSYTDDALYALALR